MTSVVLILALGGVGQSAQAPARCMPAAQAPAKVAPAPGPAQGHAGPPGPAQGRCRPRRPRQGPAGPQAPPKVMPAPQAPPKVMPAPQVRPRQGHAGPPGPAQGRCRPPRPRPRSLPAPQAPPKVLPAPQAPRQDPAGPAGPAPRSCRPPRPRPRSCRPPRPRPSTPRPRPRRPRSRPPPSADRREPGGAGPGRPASRRPDRRTSGATRRRVASPFFRASPGPIEPAARPWRPLPRLELRDQLRRRRRAARSAGSGRAGGPAPGGSRCSARRRRPARPRIRDSSWNRLLMFRESTNESPRASGLQASTALRNSATGRSTPSGMARQPASSSTRLTIRTPPSWRSPWTVPTSTGGRVGRWPAGPGRAAGPAGRTGWRRRTAPGRRRTRPRNQRSPTSTSAGSITRSISSTGESRSASRSSSASASADVAGEAGGRPPGPTAAFSLGLGARRRAEVEPAGLVLADQLADRPPAPASFARARSTPTCSWPYRRWPEADRSGIGNPYRRSQTRRAWQLTPVSFETAAIEYSGLPVICDMAAPWPGRSRPGALARAHELTPAPIGPRGHRTTRAEMDRVNGPRKSMTGPRPSGRHGTGFAGPLIELRSPPALLATPAGRGREARPGDPAAGPGYPSPARPGGRMARRARRPPRRTPADEPRFRAAVVQAAPAAFDRDGPWRRSARLAAEAAGRAPG